MTGRGTDVQATLDAWRQQGADRQDPVRFQRIDALARRAALLQGGIRGLVDARLAELVDAYAADLAAGPARDERPATRSVETPRAPSAISSLLDHLSRQAEARGEARHHGPPSASGPALVMLDDVRRMCSQVRTQSQLRQALEQAPENAGPLNSTSLVHRALTLMHDVSPEYLQPFMAYVDTLAWLENTQAQDARTAKGADSGSAAGKRPRGKARSRRAG